MNGYPYRKLKVAVEYTAVFWSVTLRDTIQPAGDQIACSNKVWTRSTVKYTYAWANLLRTLSNRHGALTVFILERWYPVSESELAYIDAQEIMYKGSSSLALDTV